MPVFHSAPKVSKNEAAEVLLDLSQQEMLNMLLELAYGEKTVGGLVAYINEAFEEEA